MGTGLTGRTLGVVGAGGIGKSYCAWRVSSTCGSSPPTPTSIQK